MLRCSVYLINIYFASVVLQTFKDRKWLGYVDYSRGHMRVGHPKRPDPAQAPLDHEDCLRRGEQVLERSANERGPALTDQRLSFSAEASELRWFLLASEAQHLLRAGVVPETLKAPFNPRRYSGAGVDYPLHQYSTLPSEHSPQTAEDVQLVDSVALVDLQDGLDAENDEDSTSFDSIEDFTAAIDLYDEEEEDAQPARAISSSPVNELWKSPIRSVMKPALEALNQFKMVGDGDRVLVCVSGGKDSLSLLHTLRQYQKQSHRFGIRFELGAITVDPGSNAYDPSPLIPYMQQLGIAYYYEKQCNGSSGLLTLLPHRINLVRL